MRKRKMSGLGGTKKHHGDVAEKAFGEASKFFARALSEAQAGNCRSAYASIGLATANRAVAFSHRDESDRHMGMVANMVNDAEGDANDAFKAVCLVGSKLSGMRRRRR